MPKFILSVIVALVCVLTQAKEKMELPELRVTAGLRDGLTVGGKPLASEIEIETEFGDVEIPLTLVTMIQQDDGKKVRVTLRNDDRISGAWDSKVFKLDSIVGRLEIAVTNLVKVGVTRIYKQTKSNSAPGASGSWKIGKLGGGPRALGVAIVLQNGKVLLAGGHGINGDDHLSSCVLFDPVTETCQQASSLNTPRHLPSAVLLNDGRVLVVGGYNRASSWLSDAELYDPATDSWRVTRPPSSHGVQHTSTLLPDGRVLVFGGAIGSGSFSGQGDIFDPITSSWTRLAQRGESRGGHAAVLLEDGSVLAAGGAGPEGYCGNAIQLDSIRGAIRTFEGIPHPRNCGQGILLSDSRVMLAGGENPDGAPLECDILNLGSGTWSSGPMLPGPQVLPGIVSFGSAGAFLIGGGQRVYHQGSTARVSFYDAQKNAWIAYPNLNEPRAMVVNSCVRLQDGRIAVFGGSNGSSGLDTYEIYSAEPAAAR